MIDLRCSIVLFLGEDTAPCQKRYIDLIGKYESIQRVLRFSPKGEVIEWIDDLEPAFQLFTAVNLRRFVDETFLIKDTVDTVPVVIVVYQEGLDRFGELITAIVEVAAKQGLADKLQFVTLTTVGRNEDLAHKAAQFHNSVHMIESTNVRLQTGVLALCDRWRGAPIGSEEKLHLAVARVTALFTLSEYNFREAHVGHFRNGKCGGHTFWVGLSAYRADEVEHEASLMYMAILGDTLDRLLATNPLTIVGDLTDTTYSALLSGVARRIGGSRPDSGTEAWSGLVERYQTEVVPNILEKLCASVRTEDELTAVLEHLATRLRQQDRVAATVLAPLSSVGLASLSANRLALGALVVGAAAAVALTAWAVRRHRSAAATDGLHDSDPGPSAELIVPNDPVLADVLDDLRRELRLQLQSLRERPVSTTSRKDSDNVLLGEQIFEITLMRKSTSARAAGVAGLHDTPRRLLLLALQSGKWRTSQECAELVKVQREAISSIVAALREDFVTWVFESEGQRLLDHSFVEEVLYASPPGAAAEVSQFCFVPSAWDRQEWQIKIDRCCLEDSIHFMYLVQHK
jgi:hypothetical protein